MLLVFWFYLFFLHPSCHVNKLDTLLGMDENSSIYPCEKHINAKREE